MTSKIEAWFIKRISASLGLLMLAFCTSCANDMPGKPADGHEPVKADLYFVRGYRSASDPCKLTGETGFTNQFLDDAADLVSCPEDYEGSDRFVSSTGAVMVAKTNGYVLYRIPRR